MVKTNDFDLTQFLNIFWKRKAYVIAVFVVVFPLVVYLAKTLPDVYQSRTLIMIRPQKLPASYVNSTVTMGIQERIRTITEELLSRTRLEEIVKQFNLYPPSGQGVTMLGRASQLRKNILVDTRNRENTFRLAFESQSPQKAQQVAARLGSIFIEENLKLREQRAVGTTEFIKTEAERLLKEVERQEAEVNIYKAKNRYELPEQLQTNLNSLENLRGEVQSNLLRLSSLEERKGRLEKQLVELEQGKAREGDGNGELGINLPHAQRIENLKTQLGLLLSQYSEKHPDIRRLKQQIQVLEAQEGFEGSDSTENPVKKILLKQTDNLTREINAVQTANEKLKQKIAIYHSRIDNTPLRSIELSKITRTYGITLTKYQDLLGKSLESQLSENMEKKQKSEQFQVIDAANLPGTPVRPNRLRLILMGFVVALGGGLGLVYLLEMLNQSFKNGNDLSDYVGLPLLASIPLITTRATVLQRRRQQALLVLGSVASLAAGLVAIRVYVQYFA